MKEAIGGISLFQIVIIFILIFTAVMCLTINHSKAFGVKDELINIIEAGSLDYTSADLSKLTPEITTEIADHLKEAGYRITGRCPDSDENPWIGYDRDGNETSGEASFCVRSNNVTVAYLLDAEEKCANNVCDVTHGNYPPMMYYDIALFYQLDLPLVSGALNFRLYGSTKVLFG